MEVIRGRERDCRQEIRGQARRGGTRSTQRVDSQRQAFRPAADEGAHPVEGGHIGCGRRLERQPDRRGAGHQHRHCRADQAPAGRGRVRGGVGPQIQLELRPAADFRRRGGSKTDRADALSGPGRLCQMEPASARGEGCRTAHCRARQRQYDRADAKKNILKPHRKQQWVIPPDANAAFVATMEDVLEVYQRPHDPQRPLVCLDETSKQLIIDTRAPIPAKPGQPARHDYEYERNGVANLFMVFAPLQGWRHVKVTDRHTAIDYATCSGICPIRIFQMRRKSCWCRIISTSTSQPRFMRPFPRPRPAGSSSASNGTTRPSTAAGSTWPNPNSAFSRRNVWIAASPTSKSSPTKSPHGRTTATSTTPKPTGNSQPPTPASS